MKWYRALFILISHVFMAQGACIQPTKFYVDCQITRTLTDAVFLCQSHQMIVVNLTNGTSLNGDIAVLNTTFTTQNCSGYFWFSSGSQTGLAANVNSLGQLLTSILTNTLNTVLCLVPLLCPATTTAAPINYAATVCTRPMQQNVIQKCSTASIRTDIALYQFAKQNIYGGVLTTIPLKNTVQCSGVCSSNSLCVGVTFYNGTCTLYM